LQREVDSLEDTLAKPLSELRQQVSALDTALKKVDGSVSSFRNDLAAAKSEQLAAIAAQIAPLGSELKATKARVTDSETALRADLKSFDVRVVGVKDQLDELSLFVKGLSPEHQKTLDGLRLELESWEKRLESEWPNSAEAVEGWRRELAEFHQKIPLWAEGMMVSRLMAIQWGVDAITALRFADAEPDTARAYEARLMLPSILDRAPFGASVAVRQELARRIEQLDKKTEETALSQIKQVFATAQSIMQGEKSETTATKAKTALLSPETVDNLRRLLTAKHPQAGTLEEQRAELLASLDPHVRDESINEQLRDLRDALDGMGSLKRLELRRQGAARVHDAAMQLLIETQVEKSDSVDAVTWDSAPAIKKICDVLAKCGDLLAEISKIEQEGYRRSLENYQKDAMQRIAMLYRSSDQATFHYQEAEAWTSHMVEKCRAAKENPSSGDIAFAPFRDYPEVADWLNQQLNRHLRGVKKGKISGKDREWIAYGADNGSLIAQARDAVTGGVAKESFQVNDLARKFTREAMVKYLLPIRVELLSLPVARVYDKAFDENWRQLSWEDQLYVAEKSVEVEKENLDVSKADEDGQ